MHGNIKDITGQRFGSLVAVSYAYTEDGLAYWDTKCDCGNNLIVSGTSLRSGNTKSCGCSRRSNIIGKRFGKLVVLSYSHTCKGRAYWNTICDCGNKTTVRGISLREGHTKSCGCLCAEMASRRLKGKSGSLSYTWKSGLTDRERESNKEKRSFQKYYEWRDNVFARDSFTCQKCGDNIGGNLNAHHIESYADNPSLRIELSNGVTLCEDCHKDFHHNYGNHSTRAKFNEWMEQ